MFANIANRLSHKHFPLVSVRTNWEQTKNNNDQIDCYHNVGTKLTMTSKYNNQNSIFAKKL